MERVIDVTFARRQLGTLLDEVYHKKETITVQRKGKSLAKIIPLENQSGEENPIAKVSPRQKWLLQQLEGLPVISIKDDPTEILRTMRENKRMKANMKDEE